MRYLATFKYFLDPAPDANGFQNVLSSFLSKKTHLLWNFHEDPLSSLYVANRQTDRQTPGKT